MRRMKRLLYRLLYALGIPHLVRLYHRKSLTIVLYHGVAPDSGGGIFNYRKKFVSPASFLRHLLFYRTFYTVLPLHEALERHHNGTLPMCALSITFDDGYRNVYEHAYPMLKRANMPATVFVATDFACRNIPLWVDRVEYAHGALTGSYEEKIRMDAQTRDRLKTVPRAEREAELEKLERAADVSFPDFLGGRAVYAPLTKADMLEMQEHRITIGAHTKSHPILARERHATQHEEIEGSRSDLANWGIRVSPVFAYPNGQPGDWSETTELVLKNLHFSHALTTIEGRVEQNGHPYRIRRITLDDSDDFATFANVVTGVRIWLKSLKP